MNQSTKYKVNLIIMWIFSVSSFVIVFIDLYLFNVPKELAVTVIIISILCFGSYLFKSQNMIRKAISSIVVSLLIILSIVGVMFSPIWNSHYFKERSEPLAITESISKEEAIEDLEFLLKSVKQTHPLLRKDIPSEFQSKYDEVIVEVNTLESINIAVYYRKVQRVMATLNDAHTVAYGDYSDRHYLKELWKLREQDYKLVSVDGVLIENVFNNKKDLLSYEVDSWGMNSLTSMLYSSEGLAYLGYKLDQGITYGYMNIYDATITEEFKFMNNDFITFEEFVEYNGRETYKIDDGESFVHYKVDKENNLAILTLNDCNYNYEYKRCLQKLFKEVKDKNITNIVIDLRKNGGGNSTVADEFISYLDCDTYLGTTFSLRLGPISVGSKNNVRENDKKEKWTYDGEVYVLSSSNTFSSAMLFTEYISDNDLGTVIGEAPANVPNGFGEVVTFQLPNSRLKLSVSCKQFYRANPEIKDIVVEPDIPCDDKIAEDVLYEIIKEF